MLMGRASIFGKHVLITDHDDWPVPEVVVGYRSQSEARRPRGTPVTRHAARELV